MEEVKNKLNKLEKYKYPFLILIIGVILLAAPVSGNIDHKEPDEAELLCRVLACSQGVGNAEVIVSENGVVVVCMGANDPQVKLDIICAVSSYTGFTSDRITVLKMSNNC